MRRIVPLALLLAGCAPGQISAPPQPTPMTVLAAYAEIATLRDLAGAPLPPLITWQVADGSVRAACHAYLNSAAQQQTQLSVIGQGVGIAGAAGSFFNPGAGVGASLVQTFLAGLSSSGYVPTTGDAILVGSYIDAYETAVSASPPTSNAMAISWADDEWYHCSAGGIAELAMLAKTRATLVPAASVAGFSARARAQGYSSRPVIVVNP